MKNNNNNQLDCLGAKAPRTCHYEECNDVVISPEKVPENDNKIYLDAGTTYSKVISFEYIETLEQFVIANPLRVKQSSQLHYYIVPSKKLKALNLEFKSACGHMTGCEKSENEIIALAKGCREIVDEDATVLDLGSRDAKWIKFKNAKFHDMDWNTSCASSTGATVEMLLKFYDLKAEALTFQDEKFAVTCGIFGLEKIMDDISNGADTKDAVAKFIHGIAYNAYCFAKKPSKIYLSGGFCENKCFVDSLRRYCSVELLGRFVLCEGLLDE